MNKRATSWLIPMGFVLWIFFVLVTFFTVQKPFSATNIMSVGNVILNLLIPLWLGLVGLGLGVWLLRFLYLDELSFLEQLVFGTAVGLGGIGMSALGVSLMGLFNPAVAYVVTIVLSAVAAPNVWRLLQQISQQQLARTMRPGRLTTLYLLLFTLFTLLTALLPPTGWDSLFYHLTGPKLYLQSGTIFSGFDVPHFNFPSLMEMLFAWAMLLRGDIAAKLLHTLYGFLLAGLIYLAARRFFGQKTAWPALLIFTSMPMVAALAGWAYNDLTLAFYQFAAIYSIILSLKQEQKEEAANEKLLNPKSAVHHSPVVRHYSALILAGIFAGLAMSLKYTSFVTPLVIVALVFWYALTESRQSKYNFQITIYRLIAFALPAFVIAAPWYLKNWAFTGNPVYPFLYGIFGGANWDSFRAEWYAAAGTGTGWQPGTLLALPWLLTLGVRDVNFWDGRTGPLLLMFLPLVVAAGMARRLGNRPLPFAGGILLVYASAHFCVWAIGVFWSGALWQSRLLLPALVALVPVTAWVWMSLPTFDLPRFSLSRFVNIAVVLTLALTLVDIGLLTARINPVPYLIGFETRQENLVRRLGTYYAAMDQINTKLPAPPTVQFLWEPRSYYCRHDCRPDSILDEFAHLTFLHGNAPSIAQAWRNAGVTHVLVHRAGLEFMLNEMPEKVDQEVFNDLKANYLLEIFDVAGAYQLYQLK